MIDSLDAMQDNSMYWELNNTFKFIFVKYYKRVSGSAIVQTDGTETYVMTKAQPRWEVKNIKLDEKYIEITQREAMGLESLWMGKSRYARYRES